MESSLFRVEKLLDQLEEARTRTDAAMKVWQETSRTLAPALKKIDQSRKDLESLQEELKALWQAGFETKWKK